MQGVGGSGSGIMLKERQGMWSREEMVADIDTVIKQDVLSWSDVFEVWALVGRLSGRRYQQIRTVRLKEVVGSRL